MSIEYIAEVSSNHNRDLARSLRMIDEAARIGCTAIKFQLFKIEELFAPEILERRPETRARKNWELPVEFIPELSSHSRELGLKFGCTPFYLGAVEQLLPYVDFYKVASYEILWDELLRVCAKTGKPVIVSTGMATLSEIDGAVKTLRHADASSITILHCVSSYPSAPEQSNLAAIQTMRGRFNCSVGWSDHSVSPAVIIRAIFTHRAEMIEFHLDLEGQGVEFYGGHNWLPDQMKQVIDLVKIGMQADGSGEKEPALGELSEREWRADPSDGLRPFKSVREDYLRNYPKK